MATRETIELSGFPVLEEVTKPWNQWVNENNIFTEIITVPPANITRNQGSYILSLAVPGIRKEDLKITLEGSLLCISSQKEEIEERFTLKEFSFCSFSRSFALPATWKPAT